MADRQFASRMARVVIASARPVTMAIVYFALALFFTSLQIPAGGRPMAAPTTCIILRLCHLENGNILTFAAEHNRAIAIATHAIYNADCSPAAAGRTANGRPYGLLFFAERSFRQWQSPKTSAGHNRAVAIAHMPFSTRIGRLPRPSIARPLLAGGAVRF